MQKNRFAAFFAILAAALYALNSPISKLLLRNMPPAMMASLLYLGAGGGMFLLGLLQKAARRPSSEMKLTRKDLPYTLGMIVLDVLAPIFLMIGLTRTTAANASLLNNFEIVATSIIALLIFKERISKRLWTAIGLIVFSSILLSDETLPSLSCALPVLLLGFVTYGLSIYFYVYAQRFLGAARTSAYYAIQPFIGVLLSLLIFREMPSVLFFIALLIMIAGTYLVARDQAD